MIKEFSVGSATSSNSPLEVHQVWHYRTTGLSSTRMVLFWYLMVMVLLFMHLQRGWRYFLLKHPNTGGCTTNVNFSIHSMGRT